MRILARRTLVSSLALPCLLVLAGGVLAAEHKAEKSEKGEPVPGAPRFMRLPTFQIPVIERDRVTRQVSLAVVLELETGASEEKILEKRPKLVDAFLSELYGIFEQRVGQSRVASDQLIRLRLQRLADRILGPGVIKQILIQQLFEQQREG